MIALGLCAKETIKIGVVLPLSGNEAAYGESFRNSMLLWQNEHRDDAEVAYKLIFEDDGVQMSKIALAARKLLTVDKVDVIMTACGRRASVIAPMAERAKTPLFVWATWQTNFTKTPPKYTFIMGAIMQPEVDLFVQTAQALGYKRLSYIGWNTPDGVAMGKSLQTALAEAGIEIVSDSSFMETSYDFRTQLLQAREAKPDALLVIAYEPYMPIFVRQWRELDGGKTPMLTVEGFDNLASNELLQGHWYPCLNPPSDEFVNKFKAAYGEGPLYGASFAYDGLGFVDKALEGKRGPFNREELNEAFHALASYDGVSGRWMNPPSGIMDADAGLFLIKDQKAVAVTVDDIVRGQKEEMLYK